MRCLFAGNQNAFLEQIIRSRIHEGDVFPVPSLGDNIPRPIDTHEYSWINSGLWVSSRENGIGCGEGRSWHEARLAKQR
jgi:hypothetical protein